MSRCRFQTNEASRGGAVAVYRPLDNSANSIHHLELTNCEFTDNSAFNGGAIWTYGGVIQTNNSLFVGNLAANNGGAIAIAQTCTNNPTDCEKPDCFTIQMSDVEVNCCTITLPGKMLLLNRHG